MRDDEIYFWFTGSALIVFGSLLGIGVALGQAMGTAYNGIALGVIIKCHIDSLIALGGDA